MERNSILSTKNKNQGAKMIEDVYYIENVIPEHEPERQFYFINNQRDGSLVEKM